MCACVYLFYAILSRVLIHVSIITIMQCIFKVQSNFISLKKSKIQISFIWKIKIFWVSSNDKGVKEGSLIFRRFTTRAYQKERNAGFGRNH